VYVSDQCIGKIGAGLLVLLGVQKGDTAEELRYLADKIIHLRIFEDQEGKMNLSLQESGGQMLLVSQFTLLADTRKGRRPSFLDAEHPEAAAAMVEAFRRHVTEQLEKGRLETGQGRAVEMGRFGADMKVSLINDGPVTITLDSRDHFQSRK
jgi:D-tyrosyl-tRNA(Tyr) deacylase